MEESDNFNKSEIIVEAIKQNTLRLLEKLNSKNLVMELKFYEILKSMQTSKTAKNEREIFYMAVNIFGKQSSVRRLVRKAISELGVTRVDLGVKNTLKGTFIGKLTFTRGNRKHTFEVASKSRDPQLIPDMSDVVDVACYHTTAVVVEKDTILSRIACMVDGEDALNKVLFVCGKGYPCKNTMMLLRMIEGRVRILGLFDFDPFGMHIYSIYKHGSVETPDLRVGSIQRIGIGMKDVFNHRIHENDPIPLNKYDMNIIEKLMKHEELVEDLMFLKGFGMKIEMEAFFGQEKHVLGDFLNEKVQNNQ